MTFGIPVQGFPISDDGELKTNIHSKWISRQRRKEEILERGDGFDKIALPGRYDVVVGRGKPYRTYTGNVWFLQLIEERQEAYRMAGRGDKAVIVKDVIETVRQRGRFVSRETGGWWVEVDEDTAIEKVSGAFRTMRRKQKIRGQAIPSGFAVGGKSLSDPHEASSTKRMRIDGFQSGGCFGDCFANGDSDEEHRKSFASLAVAFIN